MGDDQAGPTPDRAFRLLADGTRIDILRALWASADGPVPFSALREAVGNPDSGRFNYHLGELVGHFVAAADGGYELTQAGREVVRAVLAGSLTDRPIREPAPIDGHCTACGGSLVARYDEYAIVECADCGETVMWNEFPPAGLADRSPEAFATAFDRWTRARFRLAMDGICPACAARMSAEIADDGGDPATHHRCGNCRYEARIPLFGHAVSHPAVVSFYHERGVDVTALPFWDLRALADDEDVAVVSEDPWSARLTFEAGDGRLRLVLDDGFDVVEVDRSDA